MWIFIYIPVNIIWIRVYNLSSHEFDFCITNFEIKTPYVCMVWMFLWEHIYFCFESFNVMIADFTLYALFVNVRCRYLYTFVPPALTYTGLTFLARRDECPESYCRTVSVHKNFNLAYNSWTTLGRAFIFHMCIPCDKTFPRVPKFLT